MINCIDWYVQLIKRVRFALITMSMTLNVTKDHKLFGGLNSQLATFASCKR